MATITYVTTSATEAVRSVYHKMAARIAHNFCMNASMVPDASGLTCSVCGLGETWDHLAQRELADWLGEPTLADEPDDVGVYHRVRGRDDDA